jgi:tryptophanyl-tRNA synthetase
MEKPVLVSGIQPTGKLHLGNYLGAIKNFVNLQNSGKYNCFFFIADLHSLSENFNPQEKNHQIKEMLADYLALGLDFKKSVIFQQSEILEHSELAILLNNITPLGDLQRMTQFKDKVLKQKENINAGLLYYPVLMAADIILYDAAFVPIGDDQLQHLELTRTIVRKFNARFGKTFIEPKPILTKSSRLMSLNHPQKKMSKSEPLGCLFLDDAPEVIQEKIKHAVTDSESEIKYDKVNKPGISNLLQIYSELNEIPISGVEKKFKGASYQEFKQAVAQTIINYFDNFRKIKQSILKDQKFIRDLKTNNQKAQIIAHQKLLKVKSKMGILI